MLHHEDEESPEKPHNMATPPFLGTPYPHFALPPPFPAKVFRLPPLRPPISNTIQKTKLLTLNKKTFMYLWICTAQVCWHICFLCIILKYDRAPINIWLKVILNNATFTCGKTSYYLGVMQLKIDLTVFCMYKIYLFWIVLK